MGLKHWLKEGFEASSFPAPSGLDNLRYLRRKRGVESERLLRNLQAGEFSLRMLDTKVSRLEEGLGPGPGSLKHSLASAYSGVSKEAKKVAT